MSTRTLTRRGSPGRRSNAPAARVPRPPEPAGSGRGWHWYDRAGERHDVDEGLADDQDCAKPGLELEDHSPDPVRCRYGAIIAVDGTCCWRWPHPA